jgi:ATP-dependent DNA helicase RecG
LIDENSTISRKEISEKLNINQSTIQKHMDVLKKKCVIKRVGPAKGGHWKTLKK